MDQPTPSAVVFRHGTVLTMDDTHRVLTDADVLVVGDRVAEVGSGLSAPDGALEVDARLRRGLDAHAVLRLVLPRARPPVPS